jgi:hypothetical protein
VIETPAVIEVTARPGKVLTCKSVAEAAKAAAHRPAAAESAAHVATTESTAHVAATTAAAMTTTTATARKRVSRQSPCESDGRR